MEILKAGSLHLLFVSRMNHVLQGCSRWNRPDGSSVKMHIQNACQATEVPRLTSHSSCMCKLFHDPIWPFSLWIKYIYRQLTSLFVFSPNTQTAPCLIRHIPWRHSGGSSTSSFMWKKLMQHKVATSSDEHSSRECCWLPHPWLKRLNDTPATMKADFYHNMGWKRAVVGNP
jgi:hypothetical protein